MSSKLDLKLNIEKLTGAQSWRRWKRQMELMLRHHGVIDIVTGVRVPLVMVEPETEEAVRYFKTSI